MKTARGGFFVGDQPVSHGSGFGVGFAIQEKLPRLQMLNRRQIRGDLLRAVFVDVVWRKGVELAVDPIADRHLPLLAFNGTIALLRYALYFLQAFFFTELQPASAEDMHRAIVKFGEQFGFPIGPHAGTNRRDVRRRQHEQHPQRVRTAHAVAERHDNRRVADVPPKRQMGHLQMLDAPETSKSSPMFRQVQPHGDSLGDLFPDFAVVFLVAFAQVVQQQGQMQNFLALDGPVGIAQSPGTCSNRVAASTALKVCSSTV